MKMKKIALLLTVIIVVAQWQSTPQAQGNPAGETTFKNLHQLMEEGIHDRFTFVSFTLWHDTPLTPQKLETIAASAAELRQLADTITHFNPKYLKAEWAKEDQQAFEARAAELAKMAQRLAETAARKDVKETETAFQQVEASCQACHNTFHTVLRNK